MELELIIAALKQRCPVFENRVAGAAQFKILPESAQMPVPCAFVLPMEDSADENKADNGTLQDLRDTFAVVVVVSNTADEKGQIAQRSVDAMRKTFWLALLGWMPHAVGEVSEYYGIEYEGGNLMQLDRSRLYYQFEFSARMQITDTDTWRHSELAGLPHFDGVNVQFQDAEPDVQHNVPIPPPPGTLD